MDKELRLVTREETFNDLAVRELAKGRSACICNIQFGRCKREECNSCTLHKQYINCYNQLSDYDRQRLASYIAEQYIEDSMSPGSFMSYSNVVKHFIKWCIITLVILTILFIFSNACFAESVESKVNKIINGTYFNTDNPQKPKTSVRRPYKNGKIDYALEKKILLTEIRVDDFITANGDVNGDGRENCIDHAIMFKLLWDQYYTDLSKKCFIIRNYSKTMNHLFIGLYDADNNLLYIEPWMVIGSMRYSIEDYFDSNKYNPLYNRYNETDIWLEEFYQKKPIFGVSKHVSK